MFIGSNGLDCLVSMHRRYQHNHCRLQTFVLDHLTVVFVDGHTVGLEVLMRPLELGVTSAGSDQFGASCELEEVTSMTLAHTSNACMQDVPSYFNCILIVTVLLLKARKGKRLL